MPSQSATRDPAFVPSRDERPPSRAFAAELKSRREMRARPGRMFVEYAPSVASGRQRISRSKTDAWVSHSRRVERRRPGRQS